MASERAFRLAGLFSVKRAMPPGKSSRSKIGAEIGFFMGLPLFF
jgi:hypothetical protein